MIPEEYRLGAYLVSTDRARLDARAIHAFLTTSYWAEQIPLDLVERSLRGSLCFGLYAPEGQAGLARVISDEATFAYVCDVYVLPAHRGRGLARWLMQCVMASPRLQGLRRWTWPPVMRTSCTRRLASGHPTIRTLMEIVRPGLYRLDADRVAP